MHFKLTDQVRRPTFASDKTKPVMAGNESGKAVMECVEKGIGGRARYKSKGKVREKNRRQYDRRNPRFGTCYNRVSENGIKGSPAMLCHLSERLSPNQTNDMKHSQTISL